MTLRPFRAKKIYEEHIRERSLYPQESFLSIKEAMEKFAPGMELTAMLHSKGEFVISFDADNYNVNLENALKRLRNKAGIDFDYRIDKTFISDEIRDKLDLARPTAQHRLVLTFSPKNDIEWANIRQIFGVESKLTDEVSGTEIVNTVGDK